jgi:hypothetical protein
MRFGGTLAWIARAVSGFFGGLVGNQGGIRSAAILCFDLSKEDFGATATAIGVIVDWSGCAYLATQVGDMRGALGSLLSATVGVLVGTFWGVRCAASRGWFPAGRRGPHRAPGCLNAGARHRGQRLRPRSRQRSASKAINARGPQTETWPIGQSA